MKIFCFVGLGNPGKKYSFNKHNVGFIIVDFIKKHFDFGDYKIFKDCCQYTSKDILGKNIYLVKPLMYMNNSGIALKKFCDYHSMENIIIIYDDISIDLGKIRIRKKGSDGGHNGVKSIIENFSTQNIPRIRVGIGPKPDEIDLSNYVLSDFSKQESLVISKVVSIMPDIVSKIISDGLDRAMNMFNK